MSRDAGSIPAASISDNERQTPKIDDKPCHEQGLCHWEAILPQCHQMTQSDTQGQLVHSQNTPSLERVIEAWPHLPAHIQATVMTLIDAAAPGRQQQAGSEESDSRTLADGHR